MAAENQITFAAHGHVLTNTAVWSADSQWIYYDVRSDEAGSVFDGQRIERVNVVSGTVESVYESRHDACCGVVTVSPVEDRIVFIHGPEHPTSDWTYGMDRRRGVTVGSHEFGTGHVTNLDARDLVAPYTPGALRGGSHVHTFSGDGAWVAFTYEDYVLAQASSELAKPGYTLAELNQRNVGVSVPVRHVVVPKTHPRNHDGSHFSVLVTRTHDAPEPGSDQISRAFSDAWVGTHGYVRADGTRQNRAIAFQGHVNSETGDVISEVFVVDIPDDVTVASEFGPLCGTAAMRPRPPQGTLQRRLTFTAERRHPGIQGVRHWLRSHPDGSKIAFLMKDDSGIVQIWTVSPRGGNLQQLTRNESDVTSAFTWSPDGAWIAHTMDQRVCVTDATTGTPRYLTDVPVEEGGTPRPEACVVSPDGQKIAYVKTVSHAGKSWNQVFVVDVTDQ